MSTTNDLKVLEDSLDRQGDRIELIRNRSGGITALGPDGAAMVSGLNIATALGALADRLDGSKEDARKTFNPMTPEQAEWGAQRGLIPREPGQPRKQ